jgi:hypothetical protein
MPDPMIHPTRRGTAAGENDPQVSPASEGNARHDLNPDQIARWARLIAEGQEPFPTGLCPAQEEQMLQQVRRLRRARLVSYIARQLAGDIAGEHGGRHGGTDVETKG